MDTVSEARLSLINPALAAKIHTLADMLAQENIVIRVTQGLRTWAEQDALYDQGRTKPGNIVTNAKGGQSWHNFGLAVDVVPMVNGSPDWSDMHNWERIITVGQSLGLVSGKAWNDQPHLQLTGPFPTSPNDEVRQTFLDGGMGAIWTDAGLNESA